MKTPKENTEIPEFKESDLVILKSDPQELKYIMVISEIDYNLQIATCMYTNAKGDKVRKNFEFVVLIHFAPKEE